MLIKKEKKINYKLGKNQRYNGTGRRISEEVKFDQSYKKLLLKQSNELEKINAESKALLAATNNIDDEIKRWDAEYAHTKCELDIAYTHNKHMCERNDFIRKSPKMIALQNKVNKAVDEKREAMENGAYYNEEIYNLERKIHINKYDLAIKMAKEEYRQGLENTKKLYNIHYDNNIKNKARSKYNDVVKKKPKKYKTDIDSSSENKTDSVQKYRRNVFDEFE